MSVFSKLLLSKKTEDSTTLVRKSDVLFIGYGLVLLAAFCKKIPDKHISSSEMITLYRHSLFPVQSSEIAHRIGEVQ